MSRHSAFPPACGNLGAGNLPNQPGDRNLSEEGACNLPELEVRNLFPPARLTTCFPLQGVRGDRDKLT